MYGTQLVRVLIRRTQNIKEIEVISRYLVLIRLSIQGQIAEQNKKAYRLCVPNLVPKKAILRHS